MGLRFLSDAEVRSRSPEIWDVYVEVFGDRTSYDEWLDGMLLRHAARVMLGRRRAISPEPFAIFLRRYGSFPRLWGATDLVVSGPGGGTMRGTACAVRAETSHNVGPNRRISPTLWLISDVVERRGRGSDETR